MKHFIIRAIIIILISTPVYMIIRRPWRFRGEKREIYFGLFVIYMACLLGLTLMGTYTNPIDMVRQAITRLQTGELINYKLGRTMFGMFCWASADDICVNVFSNIIIFVPWGFLLPTLWERFRNPLKLIPMCLGMTVLIEFLQLFVYRATDIDDVVLNFLGGLIGAGLYFVLNKIKQQKTTH